MTATNTATTTSDHAALIADAMSLDNFRRRMVCRFVIAALDGLDTWPDGNPKVAVDTGNLNAKSRLVLDRWPKGMKPLRTIEHAKTHTREQWLELLAVIADVDAASLAEMVELHLAAQRRSEGSHRNRINQYPADIRLRLEAECAATTTVSGELRRVKIGGRLIETASNETTTLDPYTNDLSTDEWAALADILDHADRVAAARIAHIDALIGHLPGPWKARLISEYAPDGVLESMTASDVLGLEAHMHVKQVSDS